PRFRLSDDVVGHVAARLSGVQTQGVRNKPAAIEESVMAKPPIDERVLIERYGPHVKYEPPGGWQSDARHPAAGLVKTHCCFSGQQCGIQLKVRENQVIGFEPWEDFPFNRGMLCPKGVKRYMQSTHPDRLLTPLMRDASGFRPASWNEA